MSSTGIRLIWSAALVVATGWAILAPRPAAAQVQVIQNRYLRVTVQDSDGRWRIERLEGDPVEGRDDGLWVTGAADFTSTKATLWVHSTDQAAGARTGIVGGGGGAIETPPTISANGQSITMSWRFPDAQPDAEGVNLLVRQRLTLRHDLVRIEYAIQNRGSQRSVGLRLAINPAADANDSVTNPFFLPGVGLVSFQTDFRGGNVPDRWFAFFPDPDPFSWVQNLLRGLDATPPDRVAFGGYNPLLSAAGPGVGPLADYDFTPNSLLSLLLPRASNGDGSVALYWLPRTLLPGQTRTYVTYLGAGQADHGQSLDLLGSVQSPLVLDLVGGRAAPGGFRVHAWANNLRETAPLLTVRALLQLPHLTQQAPLPSEPILRLAATFPQQQFENVIGDLSPAGQGADEGFTDWLVETTGAGYGDQTFSIFYSPANGAPARVSRSIVIPHEDRTFLRNVFQMICIPYDLADDSPDAAFGLAPNEFQAVRWDPTGNVYREVESIVPGEAFWVRLNAPSGRVVDLQGATPVDIPPGEARSVRVRRGWNQIGCPSPWPIRLDAVTIVRQSDGRNFTLEQAIRAGLVRRAIWRYDPLRATYVLAPHDTRVQPGEGLWLFASTDLFILWPPPTSPGAVHRPR